MLMMKAGVLRPSRLVSLGKLGLARIETGPHGELRVGAMTPLGVLERSPLVQRGWPVIARALRTLSNVRVRNVATLGGHVAHADPHMDLPPLLAALGASVEVAGPRGARTIAIEELFAGYYETVLAKDELIAKLVVPPLAGRRAAYLKVTTRSADDWPALGVAVALDAQSGGHVRAADLFISAATEKPIRLRAAEAVLRGSEIAEPALRRAGEAAADEIEPIADAHGSASYKKALARVF